MVVPILLVPQNIQNGLPLICYQSLQVSLNFLLYSFPILFQYHSLVQIVMR